MCLHGTPGRAGRALRGYGGVAGLMELENPGMGKKDGLLGLETHDIYLTFGFFMDTKGISLGRTSKEW